jgi:hypothetical protein
LVSNIFLAGFSMASVQLLPHTLTRSTYNNRGKTMKKIIIIAATLAVFAVGQASAATVGEAAGAQASTTAKGNSDAIGVGAVAALLGVALATAGGGGDSNGSSTSTTTATHAK